MYLEKPVTHTIEEGAVLTQRYPGHEANPAVRHAAAKLVALSRCGGDDPGRQSWPCRAGTHVLVAELSPDAAAEAD